MSRQWRLRSDSKPGRLATSTPRSRCYWPASNASAAYSATIVKTRDGPESMNAWSFLIVGLHSALPMISGALCSERGEAGNGQSRTSDIERPRDVGQEADFTSMPAEAATRC